MPRRTPAAAIVAALCLSTSLTDATVPAGAAEPTPLDVFHKFYKEKQPELRVKAVSQLAGERGAPVVEALLEAAADEDRAVRERAAGVLEEPRGSPEEIAALVRFGLGKAPPEVRVVAVHALAVAGNRAAGALRDALSDRQTDVVRVAALSLANMGERGAAPKLSELLTSKDALVRAAAVESLGVLLGEDAAGTAVAVVVGDHAAEPRIAAAEALGKRPRADRAEPLGQALAAESWSVRVAAARALASFSVDAASARAAAGPLVKAIGVETRRRVQTEIADALFALTGIDFGADAQRWKAWYDEAGATFEPPAKRPQRGAVDPRGTSGHLLDLPLESEHVCFVLDDSHSMDEPLRFGVKTTKREELQRSLEAVFARLTPDSRVNLIPFNTEPKPYKPALFAATPQAKAAALQFMSKITPDGRTNIYDSLEIALSDPDADTIVLLTDGAPTEGKRRTRAAILAGVRQINRYRLARIHTIEVGAQNTSARWKGFLKEIADATGGNYLAR
jgi:HEAT repeat protein